MSDYLNLILYGLSSSVLFAFIGFVVGGLVIFFLNKKGYLDREVWLLKFITRLYFLFFPIVFFLFFWFSGSIWTTIRLYTESVNEVISEIESRTYPIFIRFINERVDTFLEGGNIPTNEEIVSLFIDTSLDLEQSSVYNYGMRVSLVTILEFLIGEDGEKERRIKILSEGISSTVYASGFDVLRGEVKNKGSLYIKVLLIPLIILFLFSLVIPTLEIYFSRRALFTESKKQNIKENLGKIMDSFLE